MKKSPSIKCDDCGVGDGTYRSRVTLYSEEDKARYPGRRQIRRCGACEVKEKQRKDKAQAERLANPQTEGDYRFLLNRQIDTLRRAVPDRNPRRVGTMVNIPVMSLALEHIERTIENLKRLWEESEFPFTPEACEDSSRYPYPGERCYSCGYQLAAIAGGDRDPITEAHYLKWVGADPR